ncbi:hypothetical protein GCM10010271_42650 [Streptomyces kurssanovii]|nr:hypothetical protein GCM10010271_42650 [Streptomyces kurssanovii]
MNGGCPPTRARGRAPKTSLRARSGATTALFATPPGSLLPLLPDIAHLQLAARYAASSTTAQVGGDWYDSFVVPNGDTALVIGDVSGHNLDAAIAMSQLRSMLRGIAIDRQEPPETVLRRLDMANHSLYREATATCVYGLVKCPAAGPWELAFSSAGHLPPLLTTAGGDTRYLEEGAGLLLGMDPDMPRARGEARTPGPLDRTPLHRRSDRTPRRVPRPRLGPAPPAHRRAGT